MNTNEIDRTKCPVCNGVEYNAGQLEEHGEAPGFWVRCCNCGLLRELKAMKTWPDLLYEKDNGILPEGVAYRIDEPKIARTLKGGDAVISWINCYKRIIEKTPRVIQYGTFLDVGFGGGEILNYVTKINKWKRIVGIEKGRDFVLFAKDQKHEVYYSDSSTCKPIESLIGKCDLIISNEIMEHVSDPIAFINGVKQYLSPNGIYWLSFAIAEPIDIIRSGEWHYWTLTSAAMLLEKAGLQILSMERCGTKFDVYCCLNRQCDEYTTREIKAYKLITKGTP